VPNISTLEQRNFHRLSVVCIAIPSAEIYHYQSSLTARCSMKIIDCPLCGPLWAEAEKPDPLMTQTGLDYCFTGSGSGSCADPSGVYSCPDNRRIADPTRHFSPHTTG
jgi:hypothetical protein